MVILNKNKALCNDVMISLKVASLRNFFFIIFDPESEDNRSEPVHTLENTILTD